MPLLSESFSNDVKCDCDDVEDEEEKFPPKYGYYFFSISEKKSCLIYVKSVLHVYF